MNRVLVVTLFLIVMVVATGLSKEIIVTSTADTSPGTLRWALERARSGDRITFDLQIYADHNTVMGLQIVDFAGSGIAICSASHNVIGGNRGVGAGPLGQGNLLSGNRIGIDLCNYGTTNVVTGNIIGTDASLTEAWCNTIFGISIEDGLANTQLGPGNVFAHNRIDIDIAGPQATGNTVTRNVFLKSSSSVIVLRNGGNADLPAPFIDSVDSQAGVVTGTACPYCVIEVYTFGENEQSVFEGTGSTNGSGQFTFEKGEQLHGSTAIALAADLDGNSSPLSNLLHTGYRLQETSPSRPSRLEVLTSADLIDNRIGALVGGLTGGGWKPGDPWDYPWLVSQVAGRGLKRLRISIDNLDADSPDLDWSIPQFTIDSSHDALISMLSDAGVAIRFVLTFWDKDTWPEGRGAHCPRFRDQAEMARYLEFVRFIADHFKGRISKFEIWNEPDRRVCPQRIEPSDYVSLVKQAVPVIHEVCPDAEIVLAATSYLGEEESQAYLFRILSSNIMPLVDVVSWHPMYGTSPEYDAEYCSQYPAIVRRIRDTASTNGFRGTYEADELTWHTVEGQFWDGWSRRYDDTVAAKYLARGVVMHLGMDVAVGVGSGLVFDQKWVSIPSAVRSLSTVMAGHEAIDMPVEIATEHDGPVCYCSFRYTNGDRMLAVWTDGVAQSEDHGVPATITFPDLVAEAVTGINVLYGFEQELVFEVDGEDTIVRDLLVKDYPILIRLSDVTMEPDYEETVGDGFHRLGTPAAPDRDGDGVPDEEDYCPDYPGDPAANGC